jgi:hypothetical protein
MIVAIKAISQAWAFPSPFQGVLSLHGPAGPPIEMKIGMSLWGMLMARGRHRSDYTLDKVRPFLSLIGNARFEPIYVAPSLRVGRVVARDGV